MGADATRAGMSSRLAAWLLPDGRRLHLSDGPIDLIVQAWGQPVAVARALDAARRRMDGLLDSLCAELAVLRQQACPDAAPATGPIAQRMQQAVAPYAGTIFITPMAAVAGAVAEAVLDAMLAAAPLDRAFVNNGGDIALHLAAGEAFSVGLVDRPDRPSLFGSAVLTAADPVRGLATSGWRGRSFSRGIADAVTVLAARAADADAAATVIANALDLPGHAGIRRVPATMLDPQSDLGAQLVVRDVPLLDPADRATALDAGVAAASRLQAGGRIVAAALHLQGTTRVVA